MTFKMFLKIFSIFVFLAQTPLHVYAEVCGVCKDSYVNCISSESSLSVCNSRLKTCESACFTNSNSGNEGQSSDKSWIFFLFIFCVFCYYVVWPLVKGFLNGLKGTSKSEIRTDPQKGDAKQLREKIKPYVGEMTVDEISKATNTHARGTIAWLLINGIKCKDYDGAAKRDTQHQNVLSKLDKKIK